MFGDDGTFLSHHAAHRYTHSKAGVTHLRRPRSSYGCVAHRSHSRHLSTLICELSLPSRPCPHRSWFLDGFGTEVGIKGFFFGLGMEGTPSEEDESQSVTESGGGGNLTLGYGFSKHWSIYGDVSGAAINADGGGTYWARTRRLGCCACISDRRPEHRRAVSSGRFRGTRDRRGRSADREITGAGAGFSFGAGLNAHFSPKVAVEHRRDMDGRYVHALHGRRCRRSTTASFDATSARLQLGLMWFPGA